MPSAIARLLQRAGLLRGDPDAAGPAPIEPIEAAPPQEPAGDGLEEIEPDSAPQLLLHELMAERRQAADEGARHALAQGAGLRAPLADVFAVSGVSPLPGDWSPERVWALLQELADVDPVTRKQRLFEALVADGLTPKAIVADALARDEALDGYEALVQQGVDETQAELDAQSAALREETARRLAELQLQREALSEELATWRAHKLELERRWTEAVTYLVGREDHDFTG